MKGSEIFLFIATRIYSENIYALLISRIYTQRPECENDKDCPSCMRCSKGNCETVQCTDSGDCGSMFDCNEQGHCAPKKCFNDYECGVFARCFNGSCYPKPPTDLKSLGELCKNDKDCFLSEGFKGRCLKASSIENMIFILYFAVNNEYGYCVTII